MKKYFLISIVVLLFTACSIRDPFSSSMSGMVTSITKTKVIGADITKIQTNYNINSGIRGFYFNDEIKGLDISVGDYVEAQFLRDENNKKTTLLKVNKGGDTSTVYYMNEDEKIIETKIVNY